MKRFLPVIICSLFMVITWSCQFYIDEKLDEAEEYMQLDPKKSLEIINSISSKDLQTRRRQARFGLLATMALDKNYIDKTDDSLINNAVEYYEKHGRTEEKMASLYYRGIVRKNSGNYTAAIVSFEMAEHEAEAIQNHHMIGLINRNKADIFSQTNDNDSAINCYLKSLEAFRKDKSDSLYAQYLLHSLSVAYLNDKQIDKSMNTLRQLYTETKDSLLLVQCDLCYARNLVEKGDSLQRAIQLFDNCPEWLFGILDYGLYAGALYDLGQLERSKYWFNKGYEKCKNQEEIASLKYLHSRIAFKEKDYRTAYHMVDTALNVQDSLMNSLFRLSLRGTLRDYYKHEAQRREQTVVRQRQAFSLGSVVMCLTIALFILAMVFHRRKKESEIKEQMASLTCQKSVIVKSNALLVGELSKERLLRLYNISEDYFIEEDENKKRDAVAKFKEAVRSLRKNSVFFSSLEKDLNLYCDSIMDKLQEQVPEIKGNNRRLIAMLFGGMPNELIRILSDKYSMGSLRTAKSRLRATIKRAGAKDEEYFLQMMEERKQPRSRTKII